MAAPASRRITLRILHLSDLHEHGPREEDRRARVNVLGDNLLAALDRFRAAGDIDLVFLTGDVAQSGKSDEYAQVTHWLQEILRRIEVPIERFFVVPGNHDIDRDKEADLRKKFVEAAGSADPHDLSKWMAHFSHATPPPGFEDCWRERILARQEAFWSWVKNDLGRAELCPDQSAHGLLGYRCEHQLEGLRHPIQIFGIDTAWMAGGGDKGRLMVTQHQLTKLAATTDGDRFPGLRLALMHHPATDLSDPDQEELEIQFGKHRLADFIFRGHLHRTEVVRLLSPDSEIRYLATGCLFEPSRGDKWRSGIQLVTLSLTPDGTPFDGEIRFESWSPRGHWAPDDSLYEGSQGGRIPIPPAMNRASPAPAPEIRIDLASGNRVAWSSDLTPACVAECWGDPTRVDTFRPVNVRYLLDLSRCRTLAHAVLRLAVHGGVQELIAKAPDDWNREIDNLLRCMGINDAHWKCTGDEQLEGRCRLMDIAGASGASSTSVSRSEWELDQLAQAMEDDMNDWVWRRLCHLVEEELRGQARQLGYGIARDVIDAMLPIWEHWQQQVADDANLIPHWLQVMLLASKQTRRETALLRLGPRTNDRCLLHACVFALGIEVGLDADTRPLRDDLPRNLRFCPLGASSAAHLCGLEWNEGLHIERQLPDWSAAPPYVLLAHYQQSVDRIMSRDQSVGRQLHGGRQRVGGKDHHHPIVFTAEMEFLDAIENGRDELQAYMTGFRKRWLEPARAARNSTQQTDIEDAA